MWRFRTDAQWREISISAISQVWHATLRAGIRPDAGPCRPGGDLYLTYAGPNVTSRRRADRLLHSRQPARQEPETHACSRTPGCRASRG